MWASQMLVLISVYNEVIQAIPVLEGSEMLSSFLGFGPCFTFLNIFSYLEFSDFCFCFSFALISTPPFLFFCWHIFQPHRYSCASRFVYFFSFYIKHFLRPWVFSRVGYIRWHLVSVCLDTHARALRTWDSFVNKMEASAFFDQLIETKVPFILNNLIFFVNNCQKYLKTRVIFTPLNVLTLCVLLFPFSLYF